jgi:transcription elongation factor Elf1
MYIFFNCDKVGCHKTTYMKVDDGQKIYDVECIHCGLSIHEPVLLEQKEPFKIDIDNEHN